MILFSLANLYTEKILEKEIAEVQKEIDSLKEIIRDEREIEYLQSNNF